jgi:putrescine transport system substrate-binding protein
MSLNKGFQLTCSWSALAVAIVAMLIGGCGHHEGATTTAVAPGAATSPPTVEAKVLNLYNWAEFIDPSVVHAFEQQYGIKVNYDVLDSEEELETKMLVGHSNYDIVVPSGAFLERQIGAGVYQKLDKTRLPNLKNLDPDAVRGMQLYDPGNQYAVAYLRSTTGIGYDVTKIKARMADAPVDSWRLFFDPAVLSKFQDCGVSVLNAPADVTSAVFAFLGKDLNSESLADLKDAERVLLAIRPYIRTVNSDKYIYDLANGDLCVALVWSGDIAQARDRAKEAGKAVMLTYSIPKEGTNSIFDTLAIPADAPHPNNAHLFLNYMLRPDVAARNSTATRYGSPVTDAIAFLSPEFRGDTGVYPPSEVRERLVPQRAHTREFTRLLMRMWTRFKTGR